MRKIKNILSAIILVVSFVVVIIMLIAKVNGQTPVLFGFSLLRISSPSMEPDLKVGDIILSQTVSDVSELKVGDIITYSGEFGSYAGKHITHEIVAAPYTENGTVYLQTQGIANEYADPQITADQVESKMLRRLNVFSAVYSFFMTPWGLAIVLIFLAILFFNEAYTLKQLFKENRNEEFTKENQSSQTALSAETDD